jgi:GTP 3',8-cyclase
MLLDRHARPLRNLRLSVTDRCNLRCSYCMPEAEYAWLPREDILHFEEIERLVDVFVSLGVDKVRLVSRCCVAVCRIWCAVWRRARASRTWR